MNTEKENRQYGANGNQNVSRDGYSRSYNKYNRTEGGNKPYRSFNREGGERSYRSNNNGGERSSYNPRFNNGERRSVLLTVTTVLIGNNRRVQTTVNVLLTILVSITVNVHSVRLSVLARMANSVRVLIKDIRKEENSSAHSVLALHREQKEVDRSSLAVSVLQTTIRMLNIA